LILYLIVREEKGGQWVSEAAAMIPSRQHFVFVGRFFKKKRHV
jgi:hypothetical protein